VDLDRPKRPTDAERDLLYEMEDMSLAGSDGAEELIKYADEMDDHCDKLEWQITSLMSELGDARRDLSEKAGLFNQLEEARGRIKSLESRIQDQVKTIEALSEAMGDAEREEWEGKLARSEESWTKMLEGRDHHITQLTQELAFLQVKLGAIQLIMR